MNNKLFLIVRHVGKILLLFLVILTLIFGVLLLIDSSKASVISAKTPLDTRIIEKRVEEVPSINLGLPYYRPGIFDRYEVLYEYKYGNGATKKAWVYTSLETYNEALKLIGD